MSHDENNKRIVGRKVLAKLVGYKPSSQEENSDDKYNGIFMYNEGEPKYYVSNETYGLEDIKNMQNLFMEIIIIEDRCYIVKEYMKNSVSKKEINNKIDKIQNNSANALYIAIRLPIIISAIALVIYLYSIVNLITYIFVLIIAALALFKCIKDIWFVVTHSKNQKF